jgi:hypothetical protein
VRRRFRRWKQTVEGDGADPAGYLTTASCPDPVTCTAQPVPYLPRGTPSYNKMDGLSCASVNQCTAVTLHQLFDFESFMVIYHWNGTRATAH